MNESNHHCDHYADQVGVVIYDLRDSEELNPCDWCSEPATLGLVKSERGRIAFCDECRELIRILAQDSPKDDT